jgi:PIN domain nuclease of toxin-antitoxin system
MNALLDTCALLWFLRGDAELSERATRLIEAPSTDAFVSAVSIWEIAIKASTGKLQIPEGFLDSFEERLTALGFEIRPVTFQHAAGVYSLPKVHQDPFDRLLISQCRAENLTAVTNDIQCSDSRYANHTLW